MGDIDHLNHDERMELYMYELTCAIIRLNNTIINCNPDKFTRSAWLEAVGEGNKSIDRMNKLHYQVTGDPDDIIDYGVKNERSHQ